MGKISTRGESRELFSREYGQRLLFAGSGTATTGTSAGAAAGAVVPRRSPESACSGRGCRESVVGAASSPRACPCSQPGSPGSLRSVQQLRLTGSARARARDSAGSRLPHLRRLPAPGPRPARRATRAGGAGAGAGGAPQGHLLAPRQPLEDVSGEAHVLPAGAEQDNLGGARALPEPVPGGLRCLWLRLVSVTGPGAAVGLGGP